MASATAHRLTVATPVALAGATANRLVAVAASAVALIPRLERVARVSSVEVAASIAAGIQAITTETRVGLEIYVVEDDAML